MNKPKVSIVVPIYNVEKYLNECIDSILSQTLKEIEIILVDDGSPDNCGKIIDAYAKKDKRVIAVHQKNSGYSKAVNHGIELAKGEYLGIIESDDWIEPDMYEKLYENAKKYNTDLTKGGFYYYNSTLLDETDQNIPFKNPSGVNLNKAPNGAFNITEWPKLLAFHASIWSSIYKTSFIKKIKIPETAGASYQDFPFMVEVMCKAKRISVVKKCFVHWRNDPEQGNSTSANGKKLLLMATNTLTARNILKKSDLYDDLKEAFYVHAVWANYGFFERIESKYKKEYYNKLKNIFAPLKNDKTFHYILFTPADRQFVNTLLNKSWPSFLARHYYSIFRSKLGRMASIIPPYRTIRFLRDKAIKLENQNEIILDMLSDLKNQHSQK